MPSFPRQPKRLPHPCRALCGKGGILCASRVFESTIRFRLGTRRIQTVEGEIGEDVLTPSVATVPSAAAHHNATTTETEKANLISQTGLYLCRQRPTLPHTFACSTIGPAGLNFRVRDGNGWNPRGKITDNLRRLAGVNEPPLRRRLRACCRNPERLSQGTSTPSRCRMKRRTFKEREARNLTTE